MAASTGGPPDRKKVLRVLFISLLLDLVYTMADVLDCHITHLY